MAAAAFLRNLIAAVPYRLHIVLTPSRRLKTNACRATDNGIQFTNHDRHIYAFEHIFDRVCREHEIGHRLTKIKHPWTNGQVEPIPLTVCRQTVAGQRNRTIKEATVKRFHYDNHDQLRQHLANFISAYNFGRRLKTLKGLTPHEFICKQRTIQPERFTLNPIHEIPGSNTYAGRIRHREKVYDGQHPAIIVPDLWQQVQAHLTTDAARDRGKKTVGSISPLIGKLFDETGDRLTPSHSQKNGRRLRYYVSRRLVTGRRTDHPDAWRLPGHHIEAAIGCILRDRLMRPAAMLDLVTDLNASEISDVQARLQQLASDCSADSEVTLRASLLRRADLRQGSIAIRMDRKTLADRLGIAPDRISSQSRRIVAPFRTQRRGVETKIILGHAAATSSPDAVLIRNVFAAHRWYDAIRKGATVGDVAKLEKVTTSRIQHMIGLAFLAPEIVRQIAAGTQPVGFTSDWFKRHQLPQDWQKQREILAAL